MLHRRRGWRRPTQQPPPCPLPPRRRTCAVVQQDAAAKAGTRVDVHCSGQRAGGGEPPGVDTRGGGSGSQAMPARPDPPPTPQQRHPTAPASTSLMRLCSAYAMAWSPRTHSSCAMRCTCGRRRELAGTHSEGRRRSPAGSPPRLLPAPPPPAGRASPPPHLYGVVPLKCSRAPTYEVQAGSRWYVARMSATLAPAMCGASASTAAKILKSSAAMIVGEARRLASTKASASSKQVCDRMQAW